MKKFWKVISRKELIFLAVIVVAVLVTTAFDTQNKIKVEFGEESVDIVSKRYSMNIPYEMIADAELVEVSDFGTLIEGEEDMTIGTGLWSNELWEEYYLCAIPYVKCIAVTLDDGRVFVFNRLDDETTLQIYEELLEQLPVN